MKPGGLPTRADPGTRVYTCGRGGGGRYPGNGVWRVGRSVVTHRGTGPGTSF